MRVKGGIEVVQILLPVDFNGEVMVVVVIIQDIKIYPDTKDLLRDILVIHSQL